MTYSKCAHCGQPIKPTKYIDDGFGLQINNHMEITYGDQVYHLHKMCWAEFVHVDPYDL